MKINSISRLVRTTAVMAVLLILAVPQVVSAVVSNQSLAVPLFERPDKGSYWNDVAGAGKSTVPFVVTNPRNGPGSAVDPVFLGAINRNDAAGIRSLGYVQTNYQARNFKSTYADIDAWYRLYPNTKGIFVDLIREGGPTEECYVAALYTHVKNIRPNDTVVLAPGGHVSPTYEPYGDIFLNAMGDYGTYQNWKVQYRGFEDKPLYQNRFWHVVYGADVNEYPAAFDLARNNNAGWTYITDKTVPTPFSATPSYWQNEVQDIANLPESSIPNRGKTTLPRGCISLSASADTTVDTTIRQTSKSTSSITVNNTSTTYDSEPVTQMQVLSIPAGASLASVAGSGWTCTPGEKVSCSYGANLPANSATGLMATFQSGCNFGEGDAVMRLINYAGNQWDIKIPLRAPIGCGSDTAASKANTDSTGQVISLTTQSTETTPEITPLGGNVATQDTKQQTTQGGLAFWKVILIVVLGVLLIGVITLVAVMLHHRSRYKVDL